MKGRRQPVFGPSALATPANALSVLRLVSAPLVAVMAGVMLRSWLLFGIWIGLSATDGLDGFLARRQGTTRSGAFLDPLADKLLVLSVMAVLATRSVLPWPPVILIALREVWMSLYRSRAGLRGKSVPARGLAKAKTWIQDIVVALAVIPISSLALHEATVGLLWFASAATLFTGLQYALAPAGG